MGQYIEGSGLDSILIEAYVYDMNTLSSVLKGTQYNRGIRGHKLMCKALRSIVFRIYRIQELFLGQLQQLNTVFR